LFVSFPLKTLLKYEFYVKLTECINVFTGGVGARGQEDQGEGGEELHVGVGGFDRLALLRGLTTSYQRLLLTLTLVCTEDSTEIYTVVHSQCCQICFIPLTEEVC